MNIKNKHEVRALVAEALGELNTHKYTLDTPEAIELLMGTWAAESNGGEWLKQLSGGPARSAWQIEKSTFKDIINRACMDHKEVLGQTAKFSATIDESDYPLIERNHKLAIQVARLKYFLCPGAIPKTLEGQAEYWKKYYNTKFGAGSAAKYIEKYKLFAI